jgi:hypothetical protein
MPDPTPPALEFALELRVNIGPTIDLGQNASGTRRTVPILGGTFSGPGLSGQVLAGGADWQLHTASGLTFVDARYAIETTDGTRIEVRNRGLRHGTAEIMARIIRGEPVAPTDYYFRTNPIFSPPDGPYEWLRSSVFIGTAQRYPEQVIVQVWKLG